MEAYRVERKLHIALWGFAVLALILRIAAADGALWLDEAWSAYFAREAGTPFNVFWKINHDNNHYLNTLWLQLTGWGAPPLLSRALSIVTGSLAVIVAGRIAARRGWIEAVLAAALFALAPILVNYGAEARGYAPMVLAFLCAIRSVEMSLSETRWRPRANALCLAVGLGMLAHLTMLFGLVALVAWSLVDLCRRFGLRRGCMMTADLTGRSIALAAAILLGISWAVIASGTGVQFGGYASFSAPTYIAALEGAVAYTAGLPLSGIALTAVSALALAALVLIRPIGVMRTFYLLAIFALPLTIAVLHIGNSAFPRYYLVSTIALLLLASDVLAAGLRHGGLGRVLAVLGIASFCAGSLVQNARLLDTRRGDPGVALTAMIERAPRGSAIFIENGRNSVVIEAAAASRHYPLRLAKAACDHAPFLYIDQDSGMFRSERPSLCGATYVPVTRRDPGPLSGIRWRLYQRAI